MGSIICINIYFWGLVPWIFWNLRIFENIKMIVCLNNRHIGCFTEYNILISGCLRKVTYQLVFEWIYLVYQALLWWWWLWLLLLLKKLTVYKQTLLMIWISRFQEKAGLKCLKYYPQYNIITETKFELTGINIIIQPRGGPFSPVNIAVIFLCDLSSVWVFFAVSKGAFDDLRGVVLLGDLVGVHGWLIYVAFSSVLGWGCRTWRRISGWLVWISGAWGFFLGLEVLKVRFGAWK